MAVWCRDKNYIAVDILLYSRQELIFDLPMKITLMPHFSTLLNAIFINSAMILCGR